MLTQSVKGCYYAIFISANTYVDLIVGYTCDFPTIYLVNDVI